MLSKGSRFGKRVRRMRLWWKWEVTFFALICQDYRIRMMFHFLHFLLSGLDGQDGGTSNSMVGWEDMAMLPKGWTSRLSSRFSRWFRFTHSLAEWLSLCFSRPGIRDEFQLTQEAWIDDELQASWIDVGTWHYNSRVEAKMEYRVGN